MSTSAGDTFRIWDFKHPAETLNAAKLLGYIVFANEQNVSDATRVFRDMNDDDVSKYDFSVFDKVQKT